MCSCCSVIHIRKVEMFGRIDCSLLLSIVFCRLTAAYHHCENFTRLTARKMINIRDFTLNDFFPHGQWEERK